MKNLKTATQTLLNLLYKARIQNTFCALLTGLCMLPTQSWAASGDCTDDCLINVNDVVAVVDAVLASEYLEYLEYLECGDVDGDGLLNINDVVAIVDKVLNGATLEEDECGICGGDNSTCVDCAGIPNGDAQLDDCGVCAGDNADDLGCGCFELGPSGCDNTCGSTLENDECGVCGGSGIAEGVCDCAGNVLDCAGECGGSAVEDACGQCGGDDVEEICDGEACIFKDCISGLEWQKGCVDEVGPDCDSSETRSWDDAAAYCDALEWGGHDKWKLPSIDQLRSLIRGCADTEYPDGSCGIEQACSYDQDNDIEDTCNDDACNPSECVLGYGPNSEGNYLPETLNTGLFWSSSQSTEDQAYYVHFRRAAVLRNMKFLDFINHVRCIKGYGCMDPNACNYDPDAQWDDGSCLSGGFYCADGTTGCDCAGMCDGDAIEDCDGVCGGDNVILAGECDCDGNVLDECGVCGGEGMPTWYLDYDEDGWGSDANEFWVPKVQCENPSGNYNYVTNNADMDPWISCESNVFDCAGECDGEARIDNCGTCDADNANDCVQDCTGAWGGALEVDECGVCGGEGIPADECDCFGNILDCAGVCGGELVEDACGVCGGDGETSTWYYDYDGDGLGSEAPNGSDSTWVIEACESPGDDYVLNTDDVDFDTFCEYNDFDECGVCEGPGAVYDCGCDTLEQLAVIGVCGCFMDENGELVQQEFDECGICGGPGIPEDECACGGVVEEECGVCMASTLLEDDAVCDEPAEEDPQPVAFEWQQSTQQAFYFFETVTIVNEPLGAGDWVGAFNCTEWNADQSACLILGPSVGSRQWDTSACNDVCEIPAMGKDGSEGTEGTEGYMQSGDVPVFIIYDVSHDIYYDAIPIPEDECTYPDVGCYGWENNTCMGFNSLAAVIPEEG
jgi:hypothetical protein